MQYNTCTPTSLPPMCNESGRVSSTDVQVRPRACVRRRVSKRQMHSTQACWFSIACFFVYLFISLSITFLFLFDCIFSFEEGRQLYDVKFDMECVTAQMTWFHLNVSVRSSDLLWLIKIMLVWYMQSCPEHGYEIWAQSRVNFCLDSVFFILFFFPNDIKVFKIKSSELALKSVYCMNRFRYQIIHFSFVVEMIRILFVFLLYFLTFILVSWILHICGKY